MRSKTKFTPAIESTHWNNMHTSSDALVNRALGGPITDPTDPKKKKPVVEVAPTDPTFKTQAEFNSYYRKKAEGILQQQDPDLYSKYSGALAEGDDLKAQAYIAARGGLPAWVPPQVGGPKMKDFAVSNYTPDHTTSEQYINTIRQKAIETKKYNQEIKRRAKVSALPSRNDQASVDPSNNF